MTYFNLTHCLCTPLSSSSVFFSSRLCQLADTFPWIILFFCVTYYSTFVHCDCVPRRDQKKQTSPWLTCVPPFRPQYIMKCTTKQTIKRGPFSVDIRNIEAEAQLTNFLALHADVFLLCFHYSGGVESNIITCCTTTLKYALWACSTDIMLQLSGLEAAAVSSSSIYQLFHFLTQPPFCCHILSEIQ